MTLPSRAPSHHPATRQPRTAEPSGIGFLQQLTSQAVQHPSVRLAIGAVGSADGGEAVLGALRQVLPAALTGLLQQSFPGETLRLYVPKRTMGAQREQRDLRIVAAADSGTPPALIAKNEGLALRTVQWVISKHRGAQSSA